MKEFYLYEQRYKIQLLSKGNIRSYKKQIAYQIGFYKEQGTPVDLRGRISVDNDVYVLMKTNKILGKYEDIETEISLLYLLNAALTLQQPTSPKFVEILVRGIKDEELLSYFYDDFQYVWRKWTARISELIDDPDKIKRVDPINYPIRFDRHKYSVYQLLKEIKTYKAGICINESLLEYDTITKQSRGIICEKENSLVFSDICDIIGNKSKANQSLLIKKGDNFSTLCFIRDGKSHLVRFMVKVEDRYLRSKLYGARVVFLAITRDILYLDISRLPVISKRFLRVNESDIVSALASERLEEYYMKRTPKPSGSIAKSDNTTLKHGYKYCELKTRLLTKDLSNLVDSTTPLDYEVRKKELKKARKKRNDLILRYLLGKNIRTGTFHFGNISARLEIDDKNS